MDIIRILQLGSVIYACIIFIRGAELIVRNSRIQISREAVIGIAIILVIIMFSGTIWDNSFLSNFVLVDILMNGDRAKADNNFRKVLLDNDDCISLWTPFRFDHPEIIFHIVVHTSQQINRCFEREQ